MGLPCGEKVSSSRRLGFSGTAPDLLSQSNDSQMTVFAGPRRSRRSRSVIARAGNVGDAEIVWGDGKQTYRKTIPLSETHPFGDFTFWGNAEADNWTWARLAVWDVAGNGAFVNPVRRAKTRHAER